LAAERSALEAKRAAAGRPVAGVWAAPGQQQEAAKEEGGSSVFTELTDAAPKPLFPPAARLNGSHPPHPIAPSSLAASH
jgi:hypothetical protein